MRTRMNWAGLATAALLAGGCSLTIDPDGVKPPVNACVSTGCATVVCGQNDNCGTTCATGSGCIACVSTGCNTVACGQPDNCGTICSHATTSCTCSCAGVTCGQNDNCGQACTTGCASRVVEGGISSGGAAMGPGSASGATHRLDGAVSSGTALPVAGQATHPASSAHKIEQGNLR